MNILTRAPGATALLVLVALAAWAAAPAEAADWKTGKIDLEASLEPADLKPGSTGLLVVKGTLIKDQEVRGRPIEGHHIYASGEQAMTYTPVPAAGVTYDLDSVELSEPIEKTDDFGETLKVWKKHFTFKVKVTLAKDTAPGTKLGMKFTYFGCTLGKMAGCYPAVKDHAAAIALGAGGAGGGAPIAPAKPNIHAPPPGPQNEGTVTLEIDEAKGQAIVTFAPSFGWHMYGPDHVGDEVKIDVKPVEADGVTWGKFDLPSADEVEDAYVVRVPFERASGADSIALQVWWSACTSGLNATCATPHEGETLRATWSIAGAPDVEPAAEPTPELVKGEILFPVVTDDDLGEGDSSRIQRLMRDSPILAFGLIFLLGLGLAFTPCVLPIIPITVSVISGGNADIPRPRLAGLLGTYVAGLALTFATMGVIAALSGGAISSIFAMPAVQWGIAILFFVLGFGMLGIYELQPPAWLMKLQGGAQRRSGSFLGAFLFGCLGAIIASPCTGPAIAGMLIVAAKEGSIPLGFSMFFMLGLGMGAVFFAIGALNFATRPGPWMVWVRYAFGVMIFGVAFYYLKNYGHINEAVLWIAGAVLAAVAAVALAWHLVHKEFEEKKTAHGRAVKVGVLTVLIVAFVAFYTRMPEGLLSWTYAKSPAHLQELVAESNAAGMPVVVDFWGTWCTNCKVYDKRIATNPDLRKRFERITRIKVDLSGEDKVRWDMRHALGIDQALAPFMVFIDKRGNIRRNADIDGLFEAEKVSAHIDVVLEDDEPVKTGAR